MFCFADSARRGSWTEGSLAPWARDRLVALWRLLVVIAALVAGFAVTTTSGAANGSSSVISDREDLAVRALLCVLWDEVPTSDDFEMTLEFFAPLADGFGGIEPALGLE
jgi:hypothetical protein